MKLKGKEPVWLKVCHLMVASLHLSEIALVAEICFWRHNNPFFVIQWLYFLGTACPHSLSTEVHLGQHVFLPPSSVWVAENYRRVGLEGASEGHPLFCSRKEKLLQISENKVLSGEGQSSTNIGQRKITGMWPSLLPVTPSFGNALQLKRKRRPICSCRLKEWQRSRSRDSDWLSMIARGKIQGCFLGTKCESYHKLADKQLDWSSFRDMNITHV